MEEYSRKYLMDVLAACEEVESFFGDEKVFADFQTDILRQRAVERNVEIMGEAINHLLKQAPEIVLDNAKAIVATRNRIIHAYDNVTPEFLWSLVINHIPKLHQDVQQLLGEHLLLKASIERGWQQVKAMQGNGGMGDSLQNLIDEMKKG